MVRARSVTGRLADMRRVPLNVSIASVTSSPTGSWVGQNAPSPITAGGVDRVSLLPYKLQATTVISSELLRTATATADAIFAVELARALAAAEDRYFCDPLYSAVTELRPASVTNGLTPNNSTGSSAAQIVATLKRSSTPTTRQTAAWTPRC